MVEKPVHRTEFPEYDAFDAEDDGEELAPLYSNWSSRCASILCDSSACTVLLPSHIASLPILWAHVDLNLPRLEVSALPHLPILTIAASFSSASSSQ